MAEKFETTCLGSSYDLRTNKWRVKCKKCNNSFEPPTTMLRYQTITCESRRKSCGQSEIIDWNTELDEKENKK